MIFAQYKPAAGETAILYTVPTDLAVTGTVYVASQTATQAIDGDFVSIQLVPDGQTPDNEHFILYGAYICGGVPIYLQQIYLNEGDKIRIYSDRGHCSFTFTGRIFS